MILAEILGSTRNRENLRSITAGNEDGMQPCGEVLLTGETINCYAALIRGRCSVGNNVTYIPLTIMRCHDHTVGKNSPPPRFLESMAAKILNANTTVPVRQDLPAGCLQK